MEYEYDPSKSGPVTQFCNLTAVEQLSLKDFHVKIIDMDDMLTASNIFEVQLPQVSEPFSLIDPKFWTVRRNGEGVTGPVCGNALHSSRFDFSGLHM